MFLSEALARCKNDEVSIRRPQMGDGDRLYFDGDNFVLIRNGAEMRDVGLLGRLTDVGDWEVA